MPRGGRLQHLIASWRVQSSRELRAAILQNGDIAERTKHHRECLDAYLGAVRDRVNKLGDSCERVSLRLRAQDPLPSRTTPD